MKQDPNQIWILVLVGAFLGCILVMQIVNNFFIVETNRLLSTFQRMDVVKESPVINADGSATCPHNAFECKTAGECHCLPLSDNKNNAVAKKKCDEGFVEVKDTCYPTIGLVKKSHHDSQNDPNLCYNWRADCDDNGQCDITCHLQKED